jgi:hypothetical protein
LDALRVIVGPDIPRWNDAPDRTQAEVVAALREAADRWERDRDMLRKSVEAGS